MDNSRRHNGRHRVVVTGLGAVSPLGLDVETTWQNLVAGKSGVTEITAFDTEGLPTRMAAAVKGFDPSGFMNHREARRMSQFVLYALAAGHEAVARAGLVMDQEDATRIGADIGSALGGESIIEEQRMVLEARGIRQINPSLIPAILINTAPCMLAVQLGMKGPVNAAVGACATGSISIGEAFRRLSWGVADAMVAGGTESVLTPLAITGFSRLGALSVRNDEPEKACAPFSANRDGTVVGEGAAVLMLETLEHAQARDADILAEVLGYCLTCDAYHMVAPDPDGAGARRAMAGAIQDAGISSDELDWVIAHGTGTQLNDPIETRAVKDALGEAVAYKTPLTSVKGAVGHMVGAAGSISAVAAIKAMYAGYIPPTINYEQPDPDCDLDCVPNVARQADVKTVMTNCFGFGGQNACLVFRKWDT